MLAVGFVRFCNVGNCWQNWLNYCTAVSDLCFSLQGQLSTLKEWKDPNKFRARQRFELALLHSCQWDSRTIAYVRRNTKWNTKKIWEDASEWRYSEMKKTTCKNFTSCLHFFQLQQKILPQELVYNQFCKSRSHLQTSWWSWKHTNSH